MLEQYPVEIWGAIGVIVFHLALIAVVKDSDSDIADTINLPTGYLKNPKYYVRFLFRIIVSIICVHLLYIEGHIKTKTAGFVLGMCAPNIIIILFGLTLEAFKKHARKFLGLDNDKD